MLENWKDTREINKNESTRQVSLSQFFPRGTRLDRFL